MVQEPVELPLKPRHLHPAVKHQKSTSSQSGVTGGSKHKITNGVAAGMRQQAIREAQEQTIRNKKVLVIGATGKRRFMLLSEYETAG